MGLFKRKRDEEKDDVVIESSGSTHEEKAGVTYRSHLDDAGNVTKREVYDKPAPAPKAEEPVIDEVKSTATAKGFAKVRAQLDNVSEKLGERFRRRELSDDERADELKALEYRAKKSELKNRIARARGQRISQGVRSFTGGQRAARRPPSVDPMAFTGLSTEAWFFGADGAGGGSGMAEFNADAYESLFNSGFSGKAQAASGGPDMGADFGKMMLDTGGKKKQGAMRGPGGFNMGAYKDIMLAGMGGGDGKKSKKGSNPMKDFYQF